MPGYCKRCCLYVSTRFPACPLCNGELGPASGGLEGAWVVVAIARNTADAEIVGGLFAANGIEYVVETRGVPMYPVPDSGLDLVLLLVPTDSLVAAEELQQAAEHGELELVDQDIEEGA